MSVLFHQCCTAHVTWKYIFFSNIYIFFSSSHSLPILSFFLFTLNVFLQIVDCCCCWNQCFFMSIKLLFLQIIFLHSFILFNWKINEKNYYKAWEEICLSVLNFFCCIWQCNDFFLFFERRLGCLDVSWIDFSQ